MSKARDLRGKVVVVTGGARGIGAATAALLHRHGMRVAIGDLDGALARRTAASLAIVGLPLDVTDRASFAGFLDEVERELGPVEVLVNNAGIMPLARVEDESEAITETILAVNLAAVIHGTREAVRRMKGRGTRGHIVNVSSAAGRIPIAGASTYVASKHGVSGFTNSLHVEFTADQVPIDASAVHPAMVRTELAAGFRDNKGVAKPVTPEAVAAGILSALQHPRPDVYVPRSLGAAVNTGGLIPRRVGEWLNRVLGGERAALDVIGDPARAAYETRATRGAGTNDGPNG